MNTFDLALEAMGNLRQELSNNVSTWTKERNSAIAAISVCEEKLETLKTKVLSTSYTSRLTYDEGYVIERQMGTERKEKVATKLSAGEATAAAFALNNRSTE